MSSVEEQQRRLRERRQAANLAQREDDDNRHHRREAHRVVQARARRMEDEVARQDRLNHDRVVHREARYHQHIHYLGLMDKVCVDCGALHWLEEKLKNSSNVRPQFSRCCAGGKVMLPRLNVPPEPLRQLFEGQGHHCRHFRNNIRSYNTTFAFTSLGVQIDQSVLRGHGPYVFHIHEELRHMVGSLLPNVGHAPSYAQLYIVDPDHAFEERRRRAPHLDPGIMLGLEQMIRTHDVFYGRFLYAHEILLQAEREGHQRFDVTAYLHFSDETDRRRYNLPGGDEIAVLIPSDNEGPQGMRDIVLRLRGQPGLTWIHEGHPAYLPLHYVLLFPRGESGWHEQLRHVNSVQRLTQRQYFSFWLFPHLNEFSIILRSGKLFQQFIVDAWASTEQNLLRYVRDNQDVLRADLYQGLADAIEHDVDGQVDLANRGRWLILPSSFVGSARHLLELFHDSMAIARFYQHPDIFLMITTNLNWVEITDALLPGETTPDRPDLVARVYEMKRLAVIDDIMRHNRLGLVRVYVLMIEFQKRTLPHMHELLFLADKIRDVGQVDNIVCTEFPDRDRDPALFSTVLHCMVHGPCDERCRDPNTNECRKRYPKTFQATTSIDGNGYPIYRHRDTGLSFRKPNVNFTYTNQNVVPYNPYLSRKYNCHINVEVCASVRAIKYIHKYIYKGHDRATMHFGEEPDEIKLYLDARYVGASEAIRRILKMPTHKEIPNVVRLQLHLEGMHHITFNPHENPGVVLARALQQKTTLTAYFQRCYEDVTARHLLYQEFPQHFTWNKQEKIWTPRQSGFAIGRMYFANPVQGERFYLRLLLTITRGAQSFEDVRTYRGVLYATDKEACIVRGLLEDDGEWPSIL